MQPQNLFIYDKSQNLVQLIKNGVTLDFKSLEDFDRVLDADLSDFTATSFYCVYQPDDNHYFNLDNNIVTVGKQVPLLLQAIEDIEILRDRAANPFYGVTDPDEIAAIQEMVDLQTEADDRIAAIIAAQTESGINKYTPDQITNYINGQYDFTAFDNAVTVTEIKAAIKDLFVVQRELIKRLAIETLR